MIRGVTAEDIVFTLDELTEVINNLAIHPEERDLIKSKARKKLGIWHRALTG